VLKPRKFTLIERLSTVDKLTSTSNCEGKLECDAMARNGGGEHIATKNGKMWHTSIKFVLITTVEVTVVFY
jgi:hypothetical protein